MSRNPLNLFAAALEIEEAKRESFLTEACAGDSGLHLEVQRMLTDAERADEFFGALDDSDEASWIVGTEHPGSAVGPYRLVKVLGKGGFGIVWQANQQSPIARSVALKIIKAGMDTKQVLARFKAESHTLSLMDHPYIARVLDAGVTDSGRPYFAMEQVDGIPVNDFCREQRIGPRERLILFRKICAAINHAHQKGILHRDLKPSNILVSLVDGEPVPKIIDFGISKAIGPGITEYTFQTLAEQFVGTPAYTSPEQASATGEDVDTRTDIFSLGVMLYELLAGVPPFDPKTLLSNGYEEMRRIIREETPSKPSTKLTNSQLGENIGIPELTPTAVQGELDWIVMKAIEKDRNRRYETVDALSKDVERYLNGEPVQAAAPSRLYQLKKFAHRNSMAIGVASAFFLVLLFATVVSLTMAYREAQARQLAEESARESDAARVEAETTARFVEEILASPDPSSLRGQVTVAELLDGAAKDIGTQFADLPLRQAHLQTVIGKSYVALGFYRKAIPILNNARETLLAHLGTEHLETQQTTIALALAYYHDDNPARVIELLNEALPAFRAELGDTHREVVSARGIFAGAMKALPDTNKEGETLTNTVYEQALELFGPEDPLTLIRMSEASSGKPIEFLQELYERCQKVFGEHHPESVWATLKLGTAHLGEGKQEAAMGLIEAANANADFVFGPEHSKTLQARLDLVRVLRQSGQYDETLTLLDEIYPKLVDLHGEEHRDIARAQLEYFLHYWRADQPEIAVVWGEQGLRGFLRLRADTIDQLTLYYRLLAELYLQIDNAERAAELLAEVYALGYRSPGDSFRTLALLAWKGKTEAYDKINRVGLEAKVSLSTWADAERTAKAASLLPCDDPDIRARVREIAEQGLALAPEDPYMLMTMGIVCIREGDTAVAIPFLRSALRGQPAYNAVRAAAGFYLALCLGQKGSTETARAAFDTALTFMRPLPDDADDPFADGHNSDDIVTWLAYREAAAQLETETNKTTPKNNHSSSAQQAAAEE